VFREGQHVEKNTLNAVAPRRKIEDLSSKTTEKIDDKKLKQED